MEKYVLTPAQTAEKIGGLKTRTLQQMRIRGDGPPFVKIGRKVFYRPQAVLDWLAEEEKRSTSEEK